LLISDALQKVVSFATLANKSAVHNNKSKVCWHLAFSTFVLKSKDGT
jgi:isopentenyldiphosphate isomerase